MLIYIRCWIEIGHGGDDQMSVYNGVWDLFSNFYQVQAWFRWVIKVKGLAKSSLEIFGSSKDSFLALHAHKN
jgi:hypothetical protein